MTKTKRKYSWSSNLNEAPPIEPHSKIKHSIMRDYIHSYLKVVANPLSRQLKLTIVDGFCGGGLYRDNDEAVHYGSPIIILQVLKEALAEILADRAANNIKRELLIECEIYFIDKDQDAIDTLKQVSAPHMIVDQNLPLKINTHFINSEFTNVYKQILNRIGKTKAIFILDPFGYSETPLHVIREIMQQAGGKCEIIWTLMIESMLTYATHDSPALINAGYEKLLNLFRGEDKPSNFCIQKEVFSTIKREIGAPFFTPFAVKQKKGWNYWLVHLAWHHRASEVMKEVEHRHANQREHYGRSGLRMMAAEGEHIYLFNDEDIQRGKELLYEDIPQILSQIDTGEGITFDDFMKRTYNETPLCSNAIKETLIKHDDIEVITASNGTRSSPKRIKTNDRIILKKQQYFNFKPTTLR